MKTLISSLLLLLAGQAQSQTVVEGNLLVGSQYNFRGVAQNDRGVVQPEIEVTVPTGATGRFSFIAWGNIDMSNDTGRAVLPNGNGGHLSEVDFTGAITAELGGGEVTFGVTSYNFPNGGQSTSEAHVGVAGDVLGLSPRIVAFYDFDQFDGFYLNGGVSRSLRIGSGLSSELGVSVGVTSMAQARAYYGADEAGFADLSAEGALAYESWNETTVGVSIHASTLLDRGLRNALDRDGIDYDNIWANFTVGRRF